MNLNRNDFLKIGIGSNLAMLSAGCRNIIKSDKNKRGKPNIIFVYADDLGAGLLGCYGQKIIKTPNIDSLATQGMKFTHSHGCLYCAPARASLLTGLHDAHCDAWNITRGGTILALDQKKKNQEEVDKILKTAQPAKNKEIFLAQLAQQAGYKTAQFGKLDWGFSTTHKRLKRHGWDHYVGYLDHQRAHGFYPIYLWEDGKKLHLKGNTLLTAGKTKESVYDSIEATKKRRNKTGKKIYSQNVFIEKILKYIDDNKHQPFFIYHSTQLPHGPVDIPKVHPDFVNNHRLNAIQKEYASMVKMLDDHVGLIIQKLKDLNIDDNTVIVFAADNGHELYYIKNKGRGRKRSYHGEIDIFKGSMNLAGLKWTNWQGGINVPLIVRWHGMIKAGIESNLLTAGYDYMPTFADIMGVETPNGKDGISFLPTLLGNPQKEHDYIIINRAVIKGEWKLVADKKGYLLFNLKNDPGERNNLAKTMVEKFKELKMIYFKEKNSPRKDT